MCIRRECCVYNTACLQYCCYLQCCLYAHTAQQWQVTKKEVLEAEFGVLVQLGFALHENPRHVSYHFARLLKVSHSYSI
jgi:hypothetical protein